MRTITNIICTILFVFIYILLRIHHWLAGSPKSEILWDFKNPLKDHWEKGPQDFYK